MNTINPTESLIMTVNEMSIYFGGHINENMFEAAVAAMRMHGELYGYPTLVCGNFVTSIGPASTAECPINQGRVPFDDYHKALETCKKNFVEPSWSNYTTVLLGKMSDNDGWYLPFIYLDGYVDIHGRDSVAEALGELELGNVDQILCKKLRWFTDLCRNIETGENSCTQEFDNESIIIDNVKNHKSLLMFSFSEILATLIILRLLVMTENLMLLHPFQWVLKTTYYSSQMALWLAEVSGNRIQPNKGQLQSLSSSLPALPFATS